MRPKALSFKLIVLRFGRLRIEVRSEERASGISLRSRPVKISSRFATYTTTVRVAEQAVALGDLTYPETLLGGQNLAEEFASSNAEGIPQQVDLLHIILSTKRSDMGFEVFSRGQLQGGPPLPHEGPDLLGVGHSGARWEQRIVRYKG